MVDPASSVERRQLCSPCRINFLSSTGEFNDALRLFRKHAKRIRAEVLSLFNEKLIGTATVSAATSDSESNSDLDTLDDNDKDSLPAGKSDSSDTLTNGCQNDEDNDDDADTKSDASNDAFSPWFSVSIDVLVRDVKSLLKLEKTKNRQLLVRRRNQYQFLSTSYRLNRQKLRLTRAYRNCTLFTDPSINRYWSDTANRCRQRIALLSERRECAESLWKDADSSIRLLDHEIRTGQSSSRQRLTVLFDDLTRICQQVAETGLPYEGYDFPDNFKNT